ncbi:MAG: LptF/LptG family permease [Gemmatimonadota bacterium]
MSILTRYILKAHLGPFFFSLSVLTGILMVNVVARQLEDLAGKGLPTSAVVQVFVLSMPHILALTLPMSVLVAVLYTFSQLAAENEITALKASGVHMFRLLGPVFVAAIGMVALMLWFNDDVLPDANHQLKELLISIGNKSPTLQLKEQVLNDIRAGDRRTRYYLEAAKIDHARNRLKDVVIYDLSKPGQERTVYADSGVMAFSPNHTDLYLTLDNGWIHELDDKRPQRFLRTFFQEYQIQIKGVGDTFENAQNDNRSDRELDLAALDSRVIHAENGAREAQKKLTQESLDVLATVLRGPAAGPSDTGARAVRLRELRPGARDELIRGAAIEMRTLADQARIRNTQADEYEVEYQKKWAISFACIVFVLIGAPLAIRFPRGGVGMVIAVSLTIFGVYYTGLIGGEQLGDKGMITPFWSMWAPNVLFSVLAIWGIARIGQEVADARGGGWPDLWRSLRNVVLKPVRLFVRHAS